MSTIARTNVAFVIGVANDSRTRVPGLRGSVCERGDSTGDVIGRVRGVGCFEAVVADAMLRGLRAPEAERREAIEGWNIEVRLIGWVCAFAA